MQQLLLVIYLSVCGGGGEWRPKDKYSLIDEIYTNLEVPASPLFFDHVASD